MFTYIRIYHITLLQLLVHINCRNSINFQVCRNINQIKICMETGRKVILLNLENLYESLYDVLNQVRIMLEMTTVYHTKCVIL